MSPLEIGVIVLVLAFGLLALIWWTFAAMPKQQCIHPHCSTTRAGCAATCPHWRDEHAHEENLGI